MVYKKVVEKIKARILYPITFIFLKIMPFIMSKKHGGAEALKITSQYGAYALHAG